MLGKLRDSDEAPRRLGRPRRRPGQPGHHKPKLRPWQCLSPAPDLLLVVVVGIAEDEDGWRPLHVAAFHDAEGAAASLLAHRADINARTRRRETALHWACRNDSVRVARALVADPRIDLVAEAAGAQTPLDWARENSAAGAREALDAALEAAGKAPWSRSGARSRGPIF